MKIVISSLRTWSWNVAIHFASIAQSLFNTNLVQDDYHIQIMSIAICIMMFETHTDILLSVHRVVISPLMFWLSSQKHLA